MTDSPQGGEAGPAERVDFAAYAELAQRLHARQRATERAEADTARRRKAIGAAIAELDDRLTEQRNRLNELARTVGQPPPAVAGGGPVGLPVPPARPALDPPRRLAIGPGSPAADSGTPALGSGAADPDTSVVDSNTPAAAVPDTPPVDPFAELQIARQRADAADAAMARTEALQYQPPLLPGWSPLARALAVYLGCALAAVGLQFVLVFASGIGVVDTVSLYSWMCAGLPAMAFFAGFIVLSVWGKPPVRAGSGIGVGAGGGGTPPRYARLGFLLCFLAMPTAYCGYLLFFRLVLH